MRKIRDQKGFTLIELMIVVVIIGILAALAIPRFNQASRQARAAEADAILGQICTMGNVYYERFSGNATALASLTVVGLQTPAGTSNYSGYQFVGAGDGFGTATATAVAPLVNKTMNCETRVITP